MLCLLFVIFIFMRNTFGGASFLTDFAFDRKPSFFFCGSRIALYVAWTIGLLYGCAIALTNNSVFLSWMRGSVFQSVSIVGLLVSVFFPLLLTYISLVIKKPIILMIVCFIKAAAFSFTGVLIHQCFGTASWLVRHLYLFSDSCFVFTLFALWHWQLGSERLVGNFDLTFCCLIGLMVVAADYWLVSPFLSGLF
jgi:hypothetical protein